MSDNLPDVTEEIRRRVAELGFELVDFRVRGTARRPMLQVRIDHADARPGAGVTVSECASVSRALERWLDGEQVLGLRYILEVSSPGIERPVRWPEHWRRFVGRDVRVRLPGRGRVRATIVGTTADERAVTLREAGADASVTVPIADARDATLVVDWSDHFG